MSRAAISVRLYKTAWCLLALACLLPFGTVATQAQQFSAEIVTRHDDASAPDGQLSVRDGRVRIETAEHRDGFFLVDTVKPSAYFVRPSADVYMDARQSSQLTWLLVPVDPDAPCRQWQTMARLAGVAEHNDWQCERMREEMIGGHTTVVFRALSGAGQELLGWIDRERRFPLQMKLEDGTLVTLARISDGPQPASSFELAPDLLKFSPEALIERIKQSDVWVSRQGDAEPAHPR